MGSLTSIPPEITRKQNSLTIRRETGENPLMFMMRVFCIINHPLVLLTKVVFENQENFKKTSEEERVVNKMQDEATKNLDRSFCVLLRVGQYRYS